MMDTHSNQVYESHTDQSAQSAQVAQVLQAKPVQQAECSSGIYLKFESVSGRLEIKPAKAQKTIVKISSYSTNNLVLGRPRVVSDPTKKIVSSRIKGIIEKINGSVIDHKEWQITHKYSDGTTEKIIVPKDSYENRIVVFTKQKNTSSNRGWPGIRKTIYFSDGGVDKSTCWNRSYR